MNSKGLSIGGVNSSVACHLLGQFEFEQIAEPFVLFSSSFTFFDSWRSWVHLSIWFWEEKLSPQSKHSSRRCLPQNLRLNPSGVVIFITVGVDTGSVAATQVFLWVFQCWIWWSLLLERWDEASWRMRRGEMERRKRNEKKKLREREETNPL